MSYVRSDPREQSTWNTRPNDAIFKQRENPAVHGGRESRPQRNRYTGGGTIAHRPEAACPPPCRDNRTISGFHRRFEAGTPCRRRTMGAGTKVLPNPSRDRDNGGVALPAHRRYANPRFPTQPPHGGGKPRRSRRGGCHQVTTRRTSVIDTPLMPASPSRTPLTP